MSFNVQISEEEMGKLLEGGGLVSSSIQDRETIYKNFDLFVADNVGGKGVGDLVSSESAEDLDKLGDCLSDYFFTMRVPDTDGKPQWPKKGYAERIKSNLKMAVMEKHQIDLTDESKFPNFSKKWRSFVVKLVEEGRSETEHHEEVDPVSVECIYELLFTVMSALKARGTSSFDEMIEKVPAKLHNKMHYIMQWGAQFMFILFDARREGENLENMKKTDMAVLEDKIKNFKFIRHVRTEADKNHALGTDTKNHGCIPFMNFTETFNPGLFFEFYLTLLPDEDGIYLFPKPRQSSKKWDIFNEDDRMFETKMKVGKNTIYKMLPELCLACDRPRQTNHSLRATAIMYMRRAGLDWETIVKITGHKDTVNIVKFYDLKLEAQGLADVAVAIGQGHSVAKGAKPSTVVLENRSNVPVDKLLPVANTACDDAMLVPYHDTLDELSRPSKVPRMDVASPVVVSTGDGENSSVCGSSNYINVVKNINNNISIQSPKIESFRAAGTLLGSMAKGMMEGVGPIIHDMLAKESKEGGE